MYVNRRVFKLILIALYLIIFVENIYYGILSVLSICLHELFHLMFLKFYKVKDKILIFSVLGFKLNLKKSELTDNKISLYLSGSLSNIFIGFFCYLVNVFTGIGFFEDFMFVNFVIGIINLSPAFPLDGIFIFRNILIRKFSNAVVSYLSIFVSLIIGIIILVLGLFVVFGNRSFNITYIVISILIFVNTFREYRLFKNVMFVTSIDLKKYLMLKQNFFRVNLICILEDVRFFNIIKLFEFKKLLVVYFMDSKFRIVGFMSEYDILECYKKFGNITVKEYYDKIKCVEDNQIFNS